MFHWANRRNWYASIEHTPSNVRERVGVCMCMCVCVCVCFSIMNGTAAATLN